MLKLRRKLGQKAQTAPASWFEGWNVGRHDRDTAPPYAFGTVDSYWYWSGYWTGLEDRKAANGQHTPAPTRIAKRGTLR